MTPVMHFAGVDVGIHRDFASFTPSRWAEVAARGDTATVFQDWHWQSAWWASFGRGELLILAAELDRRPVAILPLFIDHGTAYLVGSGGSDYLDIIGDIAAPGALEALLRTLVRARPHLEGIVWYLVPDASRSGALLAQVAASIGFRCTSDAPYVAPAMAMPDADRARRAAGKTSLVRHERQCARMGELRVLHLRNATEILPWLDPFFEQHVARWRDTGHPSLFLKPAERAFYRRLVESADAAGWLRFTVVLSNERPIAFHFGFMFDGRFLWYKPSFDITLARHSPGEVLLRRLILAAQAEGATEFDFGLGDEAFKRRFADRLPTVRTWELRPMRGS